MSDTPADLLLHPLRLRIVQALVGRPSTAGQLGELLDDVAPATLYRHLNQLESGGLIEVAEERQVRGGTERTFRVVESAISLGPADLTDVDPGDHFRYFATFVGALLTDFARYLEAGEPDLTTDRVGYRQQALWLTDDEFDEMIAALAATITRWSSLERTPDRRRRLVTTIMLPGETPRPEVQDQTTVR